MRKKELMKMHITIKRTDSSNADFQKLTADLERYLTDIDKKAHAIYMPYNRLESIKYVVTAYVKGEIVGCGAIRAYDEATVEIKRMFVAEAYRSIGIAARILKELEEWAKELKYSRAILETGTMMPGAIKFYEKYGYRVIPNYGPYSSMPKSICFSKAI